METSKTELFQAEEAMRECFTDLEEAETAEAGAEGELAHQEKIKEETAAELVEAINAHNDAQSKKIGQCNKATEKRTIATTAEEALQSATKTLEDIITELK